MRYLEDESGVSAAIGSALSPLRASICAVEESDISLWATSTVILKLCIIKGSADWYLIQSYLDCFETEIP